MKKARHSNTKGFAMLWEELEELFSFEWSDFDPRELTYDEVVHPKNMKYVALGILVIGWGFIFYIIRRLSTNVPEYSAADFERMLRDMDVPVNNANRAPQPQSDKIASAAKRGNKISTNKIASPTQPSITKRTGANVEQQPDSAQASDAVPTRNEASQQQAVRKGPKAN